MNANHSSFSFLQKLNGLDIDIPGYGACCNCLTLDIKVAQRLNFKHHGHSHTVHNMYFLRHYTWP